MEMGSIMSLAALGGLLTGSFVTLVAHRVPRRQPVVAGRSRCPHCGAQIAAYDNVPLVSWFVLRGRSRCCDEPISLRYPAIEAGLALLFAITVLALHDEPSDVVLGLAFVTTLLAVTVTDLEQRLIPNRILAVSAAVGVMIAAIGDPASLPERAGACLGAGGILLAAALAYPKGMGMGDVKLAAVMGIYLGASVAPALFVAFAAGALVGLVVIARHGAAARKRAIPFGPFLALGGVVGLLFGPELIDAYLATFS
jgi:leader peptidase (prepilin peptidase) / N-methyltransferase